MKKNQKPQTFTDHADESVAAYFSTISKIGKISAEEEAELAHQFHLGDIKALDKLVTANLRFVVSIAKSFQNRGLDLADLIEEGNLGLCKAAQAFDETRGFKFITFAVKYIQQAIIDALNEHSRLIRLPHGQIANLNRIKDLQNRYIQQFDRTAQLDEISEELDIPIDTVKAILAADGRGLSLNAPLDEDSDTTLADSFEAESEDYADSAFEEESKEKELDLILNATLKERDIYIIRHSYGIGCEELSQIEIADNLGLSRERVRQIRDNAILKLREPRIYQRLRLCC